MDFVGEMNLKRFLAIMAVSSMLTVSVVTAPLQVIAEADTTQGTQDSNVDYQTLIIPKNNQVVGSAKAYQEQKWGTGLLKDAIRYILKHPKIAAKAVEKYGGKRAAKAFLKHFGKVSASLRPLLKYSDLVDNSVYYAVYRALCNAGISSKTATNAAEAIKVALSLFF